MTELLLIRGRITSSLFWGRIVAPLLLLGGLALLLFASDSWDEFAISITVIVISSLTWIALEVYAARLRSRRMWIRDTGDGVDVVTRHEQFHIADNSITSLAIKTKRKYAGGAVNSFYRQFTIWYCPDTEPMTFETTLNGSSADPLDAVISRIWQTAIDRATAEMQAGKPFAGDGWSLTWNTLTQGEGALEQRIPRSEIDNCEELKGQICVWRQGQENAAVTFPVAGRNACLLPSYFAPQRMRTAGHRKMTRQSWGGRCLNCVRTPPPACWPMSLAAC